MKLNMAFYLGFQWVTWDHRMRAYRRPTVDIQDPNTPVRISANKIGSYVRSRIARLTKNIPEPEVRPVSDSDDDVSAARVGTRILAHELDRLNWNVELQKFLQWPEVIGWGYVHVWWDADDGDVVGRDDTVKVGEEDRLFEGNVCIDLVAPFELAVDPSSTKSDLSDARWVIRTTTMTRESAWERYGVVLTSGGSARSLSQEVHALGAVGQAEPSHLRGVGEHPPDMAQAVPCRLQGRRRYLVRHPDHRPEADVPVRARRAAVRAVQPAPRHRHP